MRLTRAFLPAPSPRSMNLTVKVLAGQTANRFLDASPRKEQHLSSAASELHFIVRRNLGGYVNVLISVADNF